jgi:two-component system chemotaxis response regulator CheB
MELLKPKIELLFSESGPALNIDNGVNTVGNSNALKSSQIPSGQRAYPPIIWELFRPRVLVIGSSTGGPGALEKLFGFLKPPFRVPILVTQHMPAVFTAALAERIGKIVGAGKAVNEVREGLHDEILLPNRVYFAPGDFHMSLKQDEENIRIVIEQSEPENFVRPAVDPLFRSAAEIFKAGTLGVVLTGMGSDGRLGSESIKNKGGSVIIQDRDSCIVYGMPGSVESVGAFDFQGNLEFIGKMISEKISIGTRSSSKDTVGS